MNPIKHGSQSAKKLVIAVLAVTCSMIALPSWANQCGYHITNGSQIKSYTGEKSKTKNFSPNKSATMVENHMGNGYDIGVRLATNQYQELQYGQKWSLPNGAKVKRVSCLTTKRASKSSTVFKFPIDAIFSMFGSQHAQIAKELKRVHNMQLVAIVETMRQHGLSPLQVAKAVKGAFGVGETRSGKVIKGLLQAGVDINTAATAAIEVFGKTPTGKALAKWAKSTLGNTAAGRKKIAQALHELFGYPRDTAEQRMKGAGFSTAQIKAALDAVYGALQAWANCNAPADGANRCPLKVTNELQFNRCVPQIGEPICDAVDQSLDLAAEVRKNAQQASRAVKKDYDDFVAVTLSGTQGQSLNSLKTAHKSFHKLVSDAKAMTTDKTCGVNGPLKAAERFYLDQGKNFGKTVDVAKGIVATAQSAKDIAPAGARLVGQLASLERDLRNSAELKSRARDFSAAARKANGSGEKVVLPKAENLAKSQVKLAIYTAEAVSKGVICTKTLGDSISSGGLTLAQIEGMKVTCPATASAYGGTCWGAVTTAVTGIVSGSNLGIAVPACGVFVLDGIQNTPRLIETTLRLFDETVALAEALQLHGKDLEKAVNEFEELRALAGDIAAPRFASIGEELKTMVKSVNAGLKTFNAQVAPPLSDLGGGLLTQYYDHLKTAHTCYNRVIDIQNRFTGSQFSAGMELMDEAQVFFANGMQIHNNLQEAAERGWNSGYADFSKRWSAIVSKDATLFNNLWGKNRSGSMPQIVQQQLNALLSFSPSKAQKTANDYAALAQDVTNASALSLKTAKEAFLRQGKPQSASSDFSKANNLLRNANDKLRSVSGNAPTKKAPRITFQRPRAVNIVSVNRARNVKVDEPGNSPKPSSNNTARARAPFIDSVRPNSKGYYVQGGRFGRTASEIMVYENGRKVSPKAIGNHHDKAFSVKSSTTGRINLVVERAGAKSRPYSFTSKATANGSDSKKDSTSRSKPTMQWRKKARSRSEVLGKSRDRNNAKVIATMTKPKSIATGKVTVWAGAQKACGSPNKLVMAPPVGSGKSHSIQRLANYGAFSQQKDLDRYRKGSLYLCAQTHTKSCGCTQMP